MIVRVSSGSTKELVIMRCSTNRNIRYGDPVGLSLIHNTIIMLGKWDSQVLQYVYLASRERQLSIRYQFIRVAMKRMRRHLDVEPITVNCHKQGSFHYCADVMKRAVACPVMLGDIPTTE